MNKAISNKSNPLAKLLPILSDDEAGERYNRWSYVNIYSLKYLKDIYLISQSVENKTVKEITKQVNNTFNSKEPWEERKVLEYLNALVKFGLLDSQYKSKDNSFRNSGIGRDLSSEDVGILRGIFLNYFRFKELSSWFINPESNFHYNNFESLSESDYINSSNLLYFYSDRSRFTDTFLTDLHNCTTKYIIESDILMRFWDVYLKWGTELKILEKYSLSSVNAKLERFSTAYFIKPFFEFDLMSFIKEKINSRYVWIPELILEISKKYRFSVNEIINFLKKEISENNRLTYERTSEIFLIGGKTSPKKVEAATYLFPIVNGSYISTLIVRK